MKKNEKKIEIEPVKVKPLFGMKPGVWLFLLYTIIVCVVVLAAGVLPGIIHGFQRVTFKNTPQTTAVYVDEKYIGGTPCTRNIESGIHYVQYKIVNEDVDEFKIKITHPVFFTWLFPSKVEITRNAVINEKAFTGLSKSFIKDVASYSAVTDYDDVYRYPSLFTRYASTIEKTAFKNNEKAKKTLTYAVEFITSQQMLDDAENAFSMLDIEFDFAEIEKSVKYKTFRTSSLPIYGSIKGTDSLVANGFTVAGFDYGTNNNEYKLAGVPVNETMYAFFVKANPKWAIENKAQLIKEGLVDENYLAGIELTTEKPTFRAITNISYHAAKAFCNWLSTETGRKVFLPTEIQWTAAASTADPTFTKSTTAMASKQGPAGMFGGVWEFTSTYYVPNDNIIDSDIQNFLAVNNIVCEPVVKGGCYSSNVDNISVYTVGIVSPFLCADTYGFRIAWI